MSFVLRLPAELQAEMQQLAEAHSRSMHGEILHALRRYAASEKGIKSMSMQEAFPVGTEVLAEDVSGVMRPGTVEAHTLDGDLRRPPLSPGMTVRFEDGELATYGTSDVDLDNPANSLVIKK